MAERRMFAKTIIDSDAFLDMPLSTQALYFHLSMRADDEGFVNNPKKIARMIGADDDSLKLLILKHFILPFDSGIVVIKHWRIHNYIQRDRFKETAYAEERAQLEIKKNGAYTIKANGSETGSIQASSNLDTECIQGVSKLDTQDRLGKVSIGEVSIGEGNDNISLSGNIMSGDSEKNSGIVQEIIEYLNQKAGTHYKARTPQTVKLIKARLKEGFTIDDFKAVIDKKTAQWMRTEWQQYLRPVTLFGTKFESYLNGQQQQPRTSMNAIPTQEDYDADWVDLLGGDN